MPAGVDIWAALVRNLQGFLGAARHRRMDDLRQTIFPGYIRDLKKTSQITLRLLGYAKKAFATFW